MRLYETDPDRKTQEEVMELAAAFSFLRSQWSNRSAAENS